MLKFCFDKETDRCFCLSADRLTVCVGSAMVALKVRTKPLTVLEFDFSVCVLSIVLEFNSMFSERNVLRNTRYPSHKFHYNCGVAFQNRVPVEPSPQFILTYFSAFSNDPILNSLGADKGVDSAESSETSEPEKHQDETPEKEMAAEIMGGDNSDNVKTR